VGADAGTVHGIKKGYHSGRFDAKRQGEAVALAALRGIHTAKEGSVMHIMSFSEREYIDVPEEEIIRNGSSYFGLPNTLFSADRGGQLMNEYLDERVYAEELGFDGVMLNEHHQTPFCGGGVMDVEASILARITKRVKIVLLGNPLPVGDPLRLAEELWMSGSMPKSWALMG
jgi:hypothetical protein